MSTLEILADHFGERLDDFMEEYLDMMDDLSKEQMNIFDSINKSFPDAPPRRKERLFAKKYRALVRRREKKLRDFDPEVFDSVMDHLRGR